MKTRTNRFQWSVPDSDVIKNLMYDSKEKTLDVTFKLNDRTYRYFDVGARVFNSIRLAESPGAYFNDRIIGRYKYKEIE